MRAYNARISCSVVRFHVVLACIRMTTSRGTQYKRQSATQETEARTRTRKHIRQLLNFAPLCRNTTGRPVVIRRRVGGLSLLDALIVHADAFELLMHGVVHESERI